MNDLTTAGHATRIGLAAPTRRLPLVRDGQPVPVRALTTSWGTATVTGRLDMCHLELLNKLYMAGLAREIDGGELEIHFDPAALRRQIGWDRTSYRQMLALLNDLHDTKVKLELSDKGVTVRSWDHVVTRILTATKEEARSRSSGGYLWQGKEKHTRKLREKREVWVVRIGAGWRNLMRALPLRYDPAVWHLQYGVNQALALFMLSHKPGARMRLTLVLTTLGVSEGKYPRRNARKQIKSELGHLRELGVEVEGKWVSSGARTAGSGAPQSQ